MDWGGGGGGGGEDLLMSKVLGEIPVICYVCSLISRPCPAFSASTANNKLEEGLGTDWCVQ